MKNSEQHQLDQLLKDKLSEGTAQVPDFVWDRIEEELFPPKKRRGFFWWFFGGCCVLLIGTFIVIAVFGQGAHSQNNTSLNAPFSANNYRKQKDNKQAGNEAGKPADTLPDFAKTTDNYRYMTRNGLLTRSKSIPGKVGVSKPRNSDRNSNSSVSNFTNLLTVHASDSEEGTSDSSPTPPIASDDANTHPIARTAVETNAKTHPDSSKHNPLSYLEILALAEKVFPEKQTNVTENKQLSCFSLGIYGGPSLYHSAVFKDYFTSGQLSKRTFASSGFEWGLQARIKVGDRFSIYAGLAFSQKQTQFTYNVAVTQADYFAYLANNEKVPLENIRDDGANSCFLAKDVTAKYHMQSVLISVGTRFEFMRIGKFSAAADVRLSTNMYASLKLKEMRVLDITQPQSEKFSYLQPGVGLSLDYHLNQRISLGVAPFFSKQYYVKTSFSRKLDELVIPLTVSYTF